MPVKLHTNRATIPRRCGKPRRPTAKTRSGIGRRNRRRGESDRRGASEWRKIGTNGLPDEGRSPKSGHQMAAESLHFPWRWNGGTNFPDLDVIRGMSTQMVIREISVQTGGRRSDPGGRRYLSPLWIKCTHHEPTPLFPWLNRHCSKRKLHDVSYREGL